MANRPTTYSTYDAEHWVPETWSKSHTRTDFERDRARLINSSAFRRLGEKTQIDMAGTDEFARTRLTHTLEVAQIGRQIAEELGCDQNIVDAACLAHDLGHPPFGHTGEGKLAEIAKNIGGFEGNAQTLRILTRLEPKIFFPHQERSAGLNLTRASLDACIKYPWTYEEATQFPQHDRGIKFCVYPDDTDVFYWVRQNAPRGVKPIEGQIMDISDDISYSVHDLEDIIHEGYFQSDWLNKPNIIEALINDVREWHGQQWDPDKLEAAYRRIQESHLLPETFTGTRYSLAELKNAESALIGRFVSAVGLQTREVYGNGPLIRYGASVVVPEETMYEITALKGITIHFVLAPNERSSFYKRQLRIISDLVEVMMNDSPRPSTLLETQFLEDWEKANNDDERLRVVIDQVASLTDGRALILHALL